MLETDNSSDCIIVVLSSHKLFLPFMFDTIISFLGFWMMIHRCTEKKKIYSAIKCEINEDTSDFSFHFFLFMIEIISAQHL